MSSDECLFGIPLKWISLGAMILQTSSMVLLLRYSRTRELGDGHRRYLNTTAVFFSECVKFLVSSIALTMTSANTRLEIQTALSKPLEIAKTCVPAFLFTVQTNLLFLALTHLPGAVYQVTYQFKIPVTAVVSVLLLGTRLSRKKWLSLLVLTIGVASCSFPKNKDTANFEEHRRGMLTGIAAVFTACLTSALASVYTEQLLKDSSTSLWMRNVQLSIFSAMFGIGMAYAKDGTAIAEYGFMQGYSPLVWLVVVGQAVGGLIIALVLKYADNIIKCFANGVALVLVCTMSFLLGDFYPDATFIAGSSLVVASTVVYSLDTTLLDAPAKDEERDPERDPLLPISHNKT